MATRLMGLGVLVFLLGAGLTRAADQPKKPSLDDDRKAIQGEWSSVPDKLPKGLALGLSFRGKNLTITIERPGFGGSNNLCGVDLAEMGKDRFVMVGGAKWPYTLEGNTLTVTMTGFYKGKVVFARGGKKVPKGKADTTVRPDPGNLERLRSEVGNSYLFEVTGKNLGRVYGTDVYTSDSVLAKAAVHAGILKVGEKGVVKVTIVPKLARYEGSTRNGVSTIPWASSWYGAYRVAAVKK